jgi:glucosamine-6-phosphate deaminase
MHPPIPSLLRSFAADALAVRVYASLEGMAAAAAAEAHEVLRQSVVAQGEARVIFACAASQLRFLEVLTGLPGLDWSRVTVFHMDEYLGVTADHPASFRRFLRERLVEWVRPGACHYLAGEAPEAVAECERYTRLLREQPVDLCCLGIGENGHVAFNDPPVADFSDPQTVKVVALDEACRRQQVGEGAFPTLAAVPVRALTLTVPALCSARRMVCVVPERRKARAVRDALHGPVSADCPASVLRRQAHCTLFLDADAAAWL